MNFRVMSLWRPNGQKPKIEMAKFVFDFEKNPRNTRFPPGLWQKKKILEWIVKHEKQKQNKMKKKTFFFLL